MKIFSEVTGREHEVKCFEAEGGFGVCHESLQNILENELGEDASYNTEVITATNTYAVAKCTISDDSGRKIQGFGDVNVNRLEGKVDSQDKFAKAHPTLVAIQTAVDTAVRSYLKWPRIVTADMFVNEDEEDASASDADSESASDESTASESSEEINVPNEYEDCKTDDVAAEEAEAKECDTDGVPDTDEVPFEEDNAKNSEETKEEPSESKTEVELGMNPPEISEAEAEILNIKERLTELGPLTPPAGSKLSKHTYDELWETNREWFDYIINNSRSKNYDKAREYATLKLKLAELEK